MHTGKGTADIRAFILPCSSRKAGIKKDTVRADGDSIGHLVHCGVSILTELAAQNFADPSQGGATGKNGIGGGVHVFLDVRKDVWTALDIQNGLTGVDGDPT